MWRLHCYRSNRMNGKLCLRKWNLKSMRRFSTYELSTNVMSRFFNSFPVVFAVKACKSPTSRQTPITSVWDKKRMSYHVCRLLMLCFHTLDAYQRLNLVSFRRSVQSEWNRIWWWAHSERHRCIPEWPSHCSVSFHNRSECSSTVCWPVSMIPSKSSTLCRSEIKNHNESTHCSHSPYLCFCFSFYLMLINRFSVYFPDDEKNEPE